MYVYDDLHIAGIFNGVVSFRLVAFHGALPCLRKALVWGILERNFLQSLFFLPKHILRIFPLMIHSLGLRWTGNVAWFGGEAVPHERHLSQFGGEVVCGETRSS